MVKEEENRNDEIIAINTLPYKIRLVRSLNPTSALDKMYVRTDPNKIVNKIHWVC